MNGLTPEWDCHAHVFGPYARYPLTQDRSYTPPEAPIDAYLTHLDALGLNHGVLVNPSAYANDTRLLFDALALHRQLRGVVVVRAGEPVEWQSLHTRGVRGLRFSARSGGPAANFAGSASFDDLRELAPQVSTHGLHAELWTDCAALTSLAPQLMQLPVPIVIDHMGGFDVHAGPNSPGFMALLRLLSTGRVWVKLCVYRNLLSEKSMELGRPFHDALLATHPERLVWGSDWPHLRVEPRPSADALLQLFRQWTPDNATQQRILQTNATALYA
jgi:predicted TIM-barrel fold metal-dependent hydrolase